MENISRIINHPFLLKRVSSRRIHFLIAPHLSCLQTIKNLPKFFSDYISPRCTRFQQFASSILLHFLVKQRNEARGWEEASSRR